MRAIRTYIAAGATVALLAGPLVVLAKFVRFGEAVPVSRLIANVSKFVNEHPREARGHYTLGRLHSLAFAGTKDGIYVEVKDRERNTPLDLPRFGRDSIMVTTPGEKAVLTHEQKSHLVDSLAEYRLSVQLAPRVALYWLGYGWMAEQAVRFRFETKSRPYQKLPILITEGWRDEALSAYRRAYRLAKDTDSQQTSVSMNGDDSTISVEAGEGILRLLGPRQKERAVAAELSGIRSHIAAIAQKPHWITPIIVGTPGRTLANSLSPRRVVRFDLAGVGSKERWPWVRPDTGILVWDPLGAGRIRSGTQLFGSRTWQMFWRNGYEPLAALDDNRDGVLSGPELRGIAVWHDRNSDGVSEQGEVVSAERAGIVSISVRPTSRADGAPANPAGMRMKDGRVLPTFDWTPRSLKPAE